MLPNIKKRLGKEITKFAKWIPTWVGAKEFKVTNDRFNKFVIDLDTQECSYRKWQLTGIPCCHAISCIYFCSKIQKTTYLSI